MSWENKTIQSVRDNAERVIGSPRIKVLHILRSLEVGGAEQVVVNYALFRSRDRYDVVVCCICGGGPLKSLLDTGGVRVHILQKQPGLDWRIVPKLMRVIQTESPDIVHTHNFTASTWGRIAAKLCRVPVLVATEHNVLIHESPFHRFVRKWLSRYTGRIIGVSEKVVQSHIRGDRIHAERYSTIYNGIDLDCYAAHPTVAATADSLNRYFLPERGKVVGIVASLTSQKGHPYFLRAARRVLETVPTTTFLIVGDGPLRAELEGLSKELGLEGRVVFTGLRSDVPLLLAHMDLFVLSSLWEGMPMAVLEAMAAGKPVVATSVGGLDEVVLEGSTGYLVPPGDENALAAAITALLRDDKLREKMGSEGRHRVLQCFTTQLMVTKTEHIYESLLL